MAWRLTSLSCREKEGKEADILAREPGHLRLRSKKDCSRLPKSPSQEADDEGKRKPREQRLIAGPSRLFSMTRAPQLGDHDQGPHGQTVDQRDRGGEEELSQPDRGDGGSSDPPDQENIHDHDGLIQEIAHHERKGQRQNFPADLFSHRMLLVRYSCVNIKTIVFFRYARCDIVKSTPR